MPDVNHAAQYYLFMKWFKKNHPQLYIKYGLQIRVPAESFKIMAAMDYVEPQDKEKLQRVIDEYYNSVVD